MIANNRDQIMSILATMGLRTVFNNEQNPNRIGPEWQIVKTLSIYCVRITFPDLLSSGGGNKSRFHLLVF